MPTAIAAAIAERIVRFTEQAVRLLVGSGLTNHRPAQQPDTQDRGGIGNNALIDGKSGEIRHRGHQHMPHGRPGFKSSMDLQRRSSSTEHPVNRR